MKNTEKLIEILNRYNIEYSRTTSNEFIINGDEIVITGQIGLIETTLIFDKNDKLKFIHSYFYSDNILNDHPILLKDAILLIDAIHRKGIDKLNNREKQLWYYISTITNTHWIGAMINV